MKSLPTFAAIISLLFMNSPCWGADEALLPAFPDAEGFGANSQGGRGGKVLFVENLNDSGPGSLRAAVEAKGPRYILFKVSGIIELEKPLECRRPFCTIAGQSAPGDGVCLKNFEFVVRTHDVVVRYLRFRPGDEPAKKLKERGRAFQPDAVTISAPARDVILDHCSASWSTDETCTVSGAGVTSITVQWCIISESLNEANHLKGPHGYGSLIRTNGDVTYHHNLYAHHRTRCPRPGTYGDGSVLFDFRNNVVFDGNGYSAEDPLQMNYVGNYIRKPNGAAFAVGGDKTVIYQTANFQEDAGAKNDDFWRLITKARPHNKRDKPFEVATVTTQSAAEAYESVLESAGATLPKRDAIDARIIEEVRSGKVGLINSQKDVGGWPRYRNSAAPKDTDNDGMPDAWETEHGFKVKKDDHLDDPDDDGYPNLEEFLNGTDPHE
jgi:pectate lyase